MDSTRNGRGVTRRRLLRHVGVAGALMLAGCDQPPEDADTPSSPSPPETTTRGERTTEKGPNFDGSLTLVQPESVAGVDPIAMGGVEPNPVVDHLYQSLYTYDVGTGLVPELAAGAPKPSSDRTTYRVTIAQAARFHDGEPVTAADVKYSFEAAGTASIPGVPNDLVESIETINETTVEFALSEAYTPFQHVLAARRIVPRTREDDVSAFIAAPVGSGPFRFAERTGGGVRVERWDEYWALPSPNLGTVTFTTVEEPADRFTALASGEADVIRETRPSIWEQIASMEEASVVEKPGLGYHYLGFNCRDGPAAIPEVREGVDHCVSFSRVVEDFVAPNGVRLYSPVPPSVATQWNLPTDRWAEIPHDRDLEAARARFDEAGVPDDWTPRLIAPAGETYERIGIAVVNGLNEAGYEATFEQLPAEEFASRHVTGDAADYDMFLAEWYGLPDPDSALHPLFAPGAEGETNGSYYRNEAVTDRLAAARRAADRETQREHYISVVETVLSDRVHLPIYVPKHSFGVRNYVRDFVAHPVRGCSLASKYNNVSVNRRSE